VIFFYGFMLLIIFPQSPHSHLPLSQEMCNNPDEVGQSRNFKLRPPSLTKNLMTLRLRKYEPLK
jgi:hypothetical protein